MQVGGRGCASFIFILFSCIKWNRCRIMLRVCVCVCVHKCIGMLRVGMRVRVGEYRDWAEEIPIATLSLYILAVCGDLF